MADSLGWLEGWPPLCCIFLLLGPILYMIWSSWMQKKGRWYRPSSQPQWWKSLFGLLLCGNIVAKYAVAEFRQTIWPHLVCFTLPFLVLIVWGYRNNFPKEKEHS